MKERFIMIQNFFMALGTLIRHPVKIPNTMLEYHNCEELKKDIEEINRERIASLYQNECVENSDIKTLDEELALKKKSIEK